MAIGSLPGFNAEQAMTHLAAIVESSEDAIIGKTLEGTILTWNAGAEHVYGYSAAEAIGRPMTLLLPEDRPDEEAEILDRIRQGQRVEHFETVRRRKNGERIDVSLTISPIRDRSGRIVGASHVARDITDRRRLDEQLRHLAAIVESSADAIVSKTLEGTIFTWNAGAEDTYGYTAEEAIGRHMSLLLPADRPDEEAEILDRIGRGQSVEHFETVRRRKNGDLIDVSLTISPVRDQSGRVVGASHVARDITERKRLEEQLRHTQKLEGIGVLAGGVAHDFNNLLTGILGNTSLAMEDLPADDPTRDLLQNVLSSSEQAAHLTRQLLAYAGKGQFVIEPVDVSRLVREISTLIQTSIPKNVNLRLELRDAMPPIQADPSQLQQLVMNLVVNGAEAIPADENGTVIVTTGLQNVDECSVQGTLAGSQLAPGLYVALHVHDNGCGMDEATLARIYDPFFTTKFMGRGLGLAAVQGIVRGHKGALKVSSRPGRGTMFKVLFPVGGRSAHPARPETAPFLLALDRLVLVVDDEEIIRRTAKSMLERQGYTVVLAKNGQEGVELFSALGERVSAVLLDMTMPVMSGMEAIGLLKDIDPTAKVILSSGNAEAEVLRKFKGTGLSGYIQKPYTSRMLAEKIKQILEAS
jgi:PAS domain S-box-containing protein